MDELNPDISSSENPQISPTLSDSFLDELFPALGENVPSTNPVAVLLNSLGTSEDRGAQSTSLFNPFNLSPPRLHEIHAIATANLISQTQEAIMQEYNITEFDLEQTDTVNDDVNSVEPYTLTELLAVQQNSCTTLDTTGTSLIHTSCLQKDRDLQGLSEFDTPKYAKESSSSLTDSNKADGNKTVANSEPLCDSIESVSEVDLAVRHIPISTENEHFNINSKSDNLNTNSESCVTPDAFQRTNPSINKPILKVPNSFNISHKKCDVIRQEVVKPVILNTDRVDYETSTPMSCHLPLSKEATSTLHVLNQKPNDYRILNITTIDNIDTSNDLTNDTDSEQIAEEGDIEISTTDTLDDSDARKVVFVCHLCHKVFNTVENLNGHHQNHQKYICPEANCARTFVSRGHLQYHMQAHKGNRRHQCDTCGKMFMKFQHLEAHVRTHTQEKPFTCTECGKGFTTEGNLKNHLRLHSGEKPYVCDVENCNKRFSELSSLKKHKVTHSGEKPYKCEICKKGFTQASSRSYHMKKHRIP